MGRSRYGRSGSGLSVVQAVERVGVGTGGCRGKAMCSLSSCLYTAKLAKHEVPDY